ncbi:MAG: protein rep [Aureispira sp.]|nr:protein rep [Aureispira sp.]
MRNITKTNSRNQRAVIGQSLDTLAQLGTDQKKGPINGACSCGEKNDIKLNKSTKSDNKRALQNRAGRKCRAVSLALNLVDIAKAKRDNADNIKEYNEHQSKVKAYWNIYHCTSKLEHNNGKVTGRYCKNRLCLVCNSIRQAQLINKYSPVFNDWFNCDDPHILTLTIENVKDNLLGAVVQEMQAIIKRVQGRIKKQLQRADKPSMKGIRKFECTYNSKRVDFHPHYHLLIDTKENAELFRQYWVDAVQGSKLINCKMFGTDKKGQKVCLQDLRRADPKALKELVKYFTKIVTTSKGQKHVFCDSLDIIFGSIKGLRTFQNFGFKLPKEEAKKDTYELELEPNEAEYIGEQKEQYIWNQPHADWISNVTGLMLSDHKKSKQLEEFPKLMITTTNSS